jgi:hypothetical protein
MDEPAKRPDVAKRNASNAKDLTNQEFGRLTVIERVGQNANGSIWLCKCSCGNTKEIAAKNLNAKKNPTRSCGCIQKELAAQRMSKVGKVKNRMIDMIGKTYDYWTVLESVGFDYQGAIYRVQCKCGTIAIKGGRFLREGRSPSCGCKPKEE